MDKITFKDKEMEKRQSIRLEKTLPIRFDLSAIPPLNYPSNKTLASLDDLSRSGRANKEVWQGKTFEGLSRNISEGGVFIESDFVLGQDFSLEKDIILNLEIELLSQGQRIKPKGRITWVSRKSRTPQTRRDGFGVKFIQISPTEKKIIALFISKQLLAQTEPIAKKAPDAIRGQKLTDRQRRNLEILNIIRENKLISRAEISKQTDINIVTVSNYIDAYLKKGLVFERGLDISTGGRRPELVQMNSRYGYVIGVDLALLDGNSVSIRAVATDFIGSPKKLLKEKRDYENIEESLDILKRLIATLLSDHITKNYNGNFNELTETRVKGIGVSMSGVMDRFAGTVRHPLTGDTLINYLTIKKELEDEFSLPVFVENTACCALFAEKWTGINLEAKTADNIIYIFSANQCAVMIKGELYTGLSRSAGQLNFVNPPEASQRKYPLDHNALSNSQYCWMSSADCIFRYACADLEKISDSKEQLFEAAVKMGAKIAYLVNIFNPQVVIIDRSFSHLGDAFLDTVRRTVSRWAFPENANVVRIIPAALKQEAAALGAASLVIEAAFTNI